LEKYKRLVEEHVSSENGDVMKTGQFKTWHEGRSSKLQELQLDNEVASTEKSFSLTKRWYYSTTSLGNFRFKTWRKSHMPQFKT